MITTAPIKATNTAMLELFIELTDQIFWEGYARQLAKEDPARFQQELNEFMDSYDQQQQQATANKQTATSQKQ